MLLEILPLTRDEELSKVWRFADLPMNYRQNLYMHKFVGKSVIKKLYSNLKNDETFAKLDIKDVLRLFDLHDDIELIASDEATHIKDGMTDYQKIFHNRINTLAKLMLFERYGHEMGDSYLHDLNRAEKKECLSSQFCSYVDKVVGYGLESVHEILSGNTPFIEDGVHNRYPKFLRNLEGKLNLISTFLESENSLNFTHMGLLSETTGKLTSYVLGKNKRIPTIKNILKPTGIQVYDYCVEAMLEEDEDFAIKILTETGRKSKPLTANGIKVHKIYTK